MANQKISTYLTEVLALIPNDRLDISKEISPGVFDTQFLKYSTLLTELNGDLTVDNLYTADDDLTGNRTVGLLANELTFASTIDANLLKLETTFGRVGIGTGTPSQKLHVVGDTYLNGQASVNTAINPNVQLVVLASGKTTGASVTSSSITASNGSAVQGLANSTVAGAIFGGDFQASGTHATGDRNGLRGLAITAGSRHNTGVYGSGKGGSINNVGVTGVAGSGTVGTSIKGVFGSSLYTGTADAHGGYFSATGAGTTNIGLYATATGATTNYAAIFDAGNVGIGTSTPTEKLEVAGNAKFSGTTYLNASSVVGQTDNGELSVGSGGNLGFVKKAGANGVLAVGSNDNFVIQKSTNGNLIGTTAASTFTDIYHQENDALIRVGRNSIAFRVDDDNGSIAPSDTAEQFQINTFAATSITVDTLGRTTLGGATADAEVVLNTDDSTAVAAGLKVKNITGVQILALSVPSNGMIVYATATSGAISSVGFWGYEAGAWVKL